MTSKPLISVIVAVYNGAKTLQRCIGSVSAQTYPNKELIIIDGGSTDGTVEIIRSSQDKITYWKSEPDNGIYDAWNKALRQSKGDWIIFLGSDDYLWKNSVFEEMVPHIIKAESQGIRMVYGQVARVTKDDGISCIDGYSWEKTWRSIIVDGIGTFTHQGMFHHRSIFELYGMFDESFKISGDYELLIRAFKDGGDAFFVDGLIVTGMQAGGITSNCIKMVKENAKARKNNRLKVITMPWLISYAWAVCYPFLNYMIGEGKVRSLVNSGKRLVMYISYKKKVIFERKNRELNKHVL